MKDKPSQLMVNAVLDASCKGSKHIMADLGLPGGEGCILNNFVQLHPVPPL